MVEAAAVGGAEQGWGTVGPPHWHQARPGRGKVEAIRLGAVSDMAPGRVTAVLEDPVNSRFSTLTQH